MLKFKKLLVASSAIAALVFSASICASAAQIDRLSIVDNTIYASVTAENARLYAVEYDEGLLSDAFFVDIESSGDVELPVGEASDYKLYLWDKESLAPVSVAYTVTGGIAYAENSTTPVPEYDFPTYSFNQDDDVMIVSSISETEIKGFKAGVETTYSLTDSIAVLGLSDSISDVVPGSVILIGTNKQGDCAAIELLASIGMPVDEAVFTSNYGVYAPSDGSTKYENVVNVMFSKSSTKIKLASSSGKTYLFESGSVQCYRVGIAMDGDTPVITYTEKAASGIGENSAFKSTSEYNNYVYLRVDTEKSKTMSGVTYEGLVTQCIVYCVPKELNYYPDPDDPYSPPFSLEPIVIID